MIGQLFQKNNVDSLNSSNAVGCDCTAAIIAVKGEKSSKITIWTIIMNTMVGTENTYLQ